MEIESMVANSALIKAREGGGSKGRSYKWRDKLRFSHISQCMDLAMTIEREYYSLCVKQPIGKKLFQLFCRSRPDLQNYISLQDALDAFETKSDEERKDFGISIIQRFLRSQSIQCVSIVLKHEQSCIQSLELDPCMDVFCDCREDLHHYLRGEPFLLYQKSMFYDRFLQWKTLERQPITKQTFRQYRLLGKGGFGEVWACQNRASGMLYACKKLEKTHVKKRKGEEMALNEKEILEGLNSRFVVNLAYAYETKHALCMVLTMMSGGDLKFHIHNIGTPGLDRDRVRFYAAEVCCGLIHLHQNSILYRDMKPENILLDDNGHIRISDLGLAVRLSEGSLVRGKVGTLGYMAPEVVGHKHYGMSVDWWGLGCLIYEMTTGQPLLRNRGEHPTPSEMERRIQNGDVEYGDKFSKGLKDLCSSLLIKDPKQRLGCRSSGGREVKSHPFFRKINLRMLEAGLVEPPFKPDAKYKKARQEIKKRSSDTLKLQKKAKKADVFGRGDLQPQLDSAMQDVNDKYLLLEETEKQAVRKALVEERSRFCCFVSMLKPVVEEEMSMLGEITHLQTLNDDLKALTMDPHKLPASSEQVIVDLKGSECTWSYQTPPSSPSTTVSRKSSMCSSLNSVNSSDSRSSGSHCHSPTSHFRYRASSSSSSSVLPQQPPARLSSVSSHDSGFISQDAFQSKSPSPMPPETSQSCVSPLSEEPSSSSSSSSSPSHSEPHSGLQKLSNGFDHHAALCLHGVVLQALDTHLHPPYFTYSTSTTTTTSPISSPSYSSVSPTWPWSRSGSGQSGDFPPLSPSGIGSVPSSRVPSWKDWAKPGPYDQSVVNTLKRSRDRRETTDPSSHHGADVATPGDEPHGVRGSQSVTSHKDDREAHEELARALARGLQLDIHGSSRDSLQGSSGYSSQTNTPCCSEDTIPSQVSDCDYYSVGADQDGEHQQSSDFDKSSTIPRNSDISQSYRRMFQSKRPASTAGLPSNPAAIITPGVATIRRTPSSKPNLRRPSGGLSLGPIPIKPPMIPVKTPTVPDHHGFPSRAASEDGNAPRTPLSPPTTLLSPGSNGPLSPKSGPWETQHLTEGSDPPTPPPQPGGRVSEWERRPLPELLEETEYSEVEDFLVAIRRGVRLKKTSTNDRSAPIIH